MCAVGPGFSRRLGRDPDYGLRRTKRTYRTDGQKPAGPRLVSLRRLLRRPHSERVHRQRRRRARWLLLGTGLASSAFGVGRLIVVGDMAAQVATAAGLLLLFLFGLSWLRATPALRAGALLFGLLTPAAYFGIATYGPDHPGLYIIQSPVSMAALGAMIVILIGLVSGARSARALDAAGAGDDADPDRR